MVSEVTLSFDIPRASHDTFKRKRHIGIGKAYGRKRGIYFVHAVHMRVVRVIAPYATD